MKTRKHEWLKSTRLIYDDELDFRLRIFRDINTHCSALIHIHVKGKHLTLTQMYNAWSSDHRVIWERNKNDIIERYGKPTFVSVRICNVTKQVL